MKEAFLLAAFCSGYLTPIWGVDTAPPEPFPFFALISHPDPGKFDFRERPVVKKEKQVSLIYKNTIKHGRVQDPAMAWDWGFRTGIGWNTTVKNWNLIATYTKFHTKSFASVATDGAAPAPSLREVKTKNNQFRFGENTPAWRMHLNLADLELGKKIATTDRFSFRPHAGLRAAWVYQKRKKADVETDEPSYRQQPLFRSNNCAGIGFRSGVDSLWNFAKGMSLFGDGALSVLAGYYNVNEKKKSGEPLSIAPEEPNKASNSIATGEFSVGMQYESRIAAKNFLTLRLGYEMNYVFNQTRWGDWIGNARGALSDVGSGISLQGLTFGCRFDF